MSFNLCPGVRLFDVYIQADGQKLSFQSNYSKVLSTKSSTLSCNAVWDIKEDNYNIYTIINKLVLTYWTGVGLLGAAGICPDSGFAWGPVTGRYSNRL